VAVWWRPLTQKSWNGSIGKYGIIRVEEIGETCRMNMLIYFIQSVSKYEKITKKNKKTLERETVVLAVWWRPLT